MPIRLSTLPTLFILFLIASTSTAATVTWDGGGDGQDWNDPLNWDGDQIPGVDDDVLIDPANGDPPSITVVFSSGTTSIRSLDCNANLTVSGGTLSVATSAVVAGEALLQGGSLENGTWDYSRSLRVRGTTNNVLDGVTVTGSILVDSQNSILRIIGGSTFETVRLVIDRTYILFSPNQTITGDVLIESSLGGIQQEGGTGTLTVGPSGSIQSISSEASDIVDIPGSEFTLVNQGLISTSSPSASLTVRPSSIINEGIIESSGGFLTIAADELTNTGTLAAADGGTLEFVGTTTTNGLVPITNETGTVRFRGTIDNNRSTLALRGAGTWFLQGGRINGGQLDLDDGALLRARGATNNVLDGVTATGSILVDQQFAVLRIIGGSTFETVRLVGFGSNIRFSPDQTITGDVLIEASEAKVWQEGGTGTLTVAPSGSIQFIAFGISSVSELPGSEFTLVNQGLISTSSPSASLTLRPSVVINEGIIESHDGFLTIDADQWTNAGSIRSEGSGTRVELRNAWSSSGTLEASAGGELDLFGSIGGIDSFTAIDGGVVRLRGTLDNTASTLSITEATGDLRLRGGTITSGTIDGDGFGALVVEPSTGGTNTLAGVAIAQQAIVDLGRFPEGGDLIIDQGVVLDGTLIISADTNGQSADLGVTAPDALISGTGRIQIGDRAVLAVASPGATLTIGEGIDVVGTGTVASFLGRDDRGLVIEGAVTVGNGKSPALLDIRGTPCFLNGGVQAETQAILAIPFLSNYEPGARRLVGGEYSEIGGSVQLPKSTAIERLQASFELEAGGDYDELDTLVEIEPAPKRGEPSGIIRLTAGRDLTVTPAGGMTTNASELILEPGSIFSVEGDYAQAPSGAARFEIDGTNDNRVIADGGDVLVDGTLEVTLAEGFRPRCGEAFILFEAASAGGKGGSVGGGFPILLLPDGPPWIDYEITPIIPQASTIELITLCDPGVYSGPDGGSWFDPSHWGGGEGGVPDAETDVLLPAPVVIDQLGAVAASVTIVDAGELTIGGPTPGSLVTGPVSVLAGGLLHLSDGGSMQASSLTIESGGVLIVDPGASLEVSAVNIADGAELILAGGDVELANGVLEIAGDFVVGPELSLSLIDMGTTIGGSLEVFGTFLADGGLLDVAGPIVATGSATIAGDGTAAAASATVDPGSLTITLGATLTLSGDAQVAADGQLVVGVDATLQAAAVSLAAGATYGGNGTLIAPLILDGSLAPGEGPGGIGTVAIDGTLTLGSTSVLAIDLAAPAEGGSSGVADSVTASGEIAVAGTLSVALVDGFIPQVGDDYLVIRSDTGLVGGLDAVELPFPGPEVRWLVLQQADRIRLLGALQGDTNGDGIVDLQDLLTLLSDWGPCAVCPADLDGDSDVGLNDLLLLLGNWGGS